MNLLVWILITGMASGPGSTTFTDLHVDFLGEAAAANHSLGFIYLDMDTSGDGLPDFFLIGPDQDLDGDGLNNNIDSDDDGDGIPDYLDKAGYQVTTGAQAGWAPLNGSTDASLFQNGLAAAAAGDHADDYWQFVPNGTFEQDGSAYVDGAGNPWPNQFKAAGAYLYVDQTDRDGNSGADGVPDVLQIPRQVNQLAVMTLLKDYQSQTSSGQPGPGLLGTWDGAPSGHLLFQLCDDDGGTAVSSHFQSFYPYRSNGSPNVTDSAECPDGWPDYLIYGTDDELSAAIPAELKYNDANGERLWRYRSLVPDVSDARELVYFLNVYWWSGGQRVNTYYSRAEFNESVYMQFGRNARTSGDGYGLADSDVPVGAPLNNFFPHYRNLSDHDVVAMSVFGVDWEDIATAPLDGSAPIALDPADQPWVDAYQNYTFDARIMNFIEMETALTQMPQDLVALILSRYQVDLAMMDSRCLPRNTAGKNSHAICLETGSGYLLSWEDLYGGGDRNFSDVVFYTNRAPIVTD